MENQNPEVEKYELNPEAAKQFNHIGPHAVWETRTDGKFDIRTITVAAIEKLIEAGCEWFERKADAKPADKPKVLPPAPPATT